MTVFSMILHSTHLHIVFPLNIEYTLDIIIEYMSYLFISDLSLRKTFLTRIQMTWNTSPSEYLLECQVGRDIVIIGITSDQGQQEFCRANVKICCQEIHQASNITTEIMFN